MADGYAAAEALLDGGDGGLKELKLALCEVDVVRIRLVGDGKVRENALDIEIRHIAAVDDAVNAGIEMPSGTEHAEA